MKEEGKRVSKFDVLRNRASELEAAGDLVAALGVYDDLLREFELDPDSQDDGADVHVQMGDLRRQLGQPARSFASYQAAAELFAAKGASQKISELCVRMINVVPAAGDAYVRYARRLFDHEHDDAALELLREFSNKAAVESVADQVNAAMRGSSGERRGQVERLLRTIEENTDSHTSAARRVSQELFQAVGPNDHQTTPAKIKPQPRAPRRAPKTPSVDDARASVIRGLPKEGRTHTSVTPRHTPILNWKYVGGGVGGVGLVGLVIFAAASLGGGNSSAVTTTESTAGSTAAPQVALTAPIDSTVNQPTVAQSNPPAATPAPPPAPTPTQTPPASGTTAVQPVARVITEPMVVESLAVQSIEQVAFRGQQGFRVVHLLDSGVQFIVESYPVDSSSAASYPVGTVIVNVVPPDTTVSIVRPDEEHLVFASGVVPEDSARVLIGLLRVRTPAN